ncbi:PREDICTED: uncharacterized protein LOC104802620 [Tarenaya hassleriana]|uniref:uncharacterized protein LOC104802620 n=1 Tax=Tarenaya hassleriana TaxID=28532 RepID=UPI00053C2909|nr:PREDICTED: uncharacterized protein LOC104802620 [Tarenaya hassleriana]XP_010524606.1 PREDICTED: uncharacterized protein LOC104802620 [Tarenaya hassleriana]XP_010524608.1 PREDICTED: uncharacterized protein LOC104802620 [Tarenaya hassleriana]
MAPTGSLGLVDPGWEHGVAQDERKKKVKCNYCGKIVSGGIYRLKQHLARVSGEVTYCEKSPEEVCLRMKENLERCRSSRKLRLSEGHSGQPSPNFQRSNNDEDGEEEEHSSWFRNKGKQPFGDGNLRSSGYIDPGWEHGVAQDERKKKVKCNYCDKIVSGGINRFKQHLARIPGEVAPCKNTPEEVYLKIKENMKWHRAGRRQTRLDDVGVSNFNALMQNADREDDQEDDDFCSISEDRSVRGDRRFNQGNRKSFNAMPIRAVSEPKPKRSRPNPLLKPPHVLTLSLSKQRKTHTGSSRIVSRKELASAICKFFHHAGVPAEAANSLYFHKMIELVGMYGQGFVAPSRQLLTGRLLQNEISTIKGYLAEYRSSWMVTGCSIIADTWVNTEGRTLISFLVSCPRGIYFHSSTDATDVTEDAFSLFKHLDKLVEDVGEENIVQVVTHNTAAYRTAGKLLEEKRKNLYWTPCAMHCTEQVLEDFSKLEVVSECMEKSQKITKFVYNQPLLLNLMKNEFTQGQELLRPSVTRYASGFATLQSLMDHRVSLRGLFHSNGWMSSPAAKSDGGREVEKIISNASFWKKVQYVLKSVDPVMQVVQMIDGGEMLSLPYVYSYMYRAKLAIKSIHNDDARKYGPFWRVMDYHWNSLFHHPLYVAAYFFNPAYRYCPDFMAHSEVVRGVNECIVRLEPDNIRRVTALMQIPDYTSAKADFGTDLAIGTRTELDPAAWWQQHGISCLELQRVAVRILSHTCSSFGCEPRWSVYDQMAGKCQSRFFKKSFNDLTYVHYNLRLREKQLRRRTPDDTPSLNGTMLEHLLRDWLATTTSDEETLREEEEEEGRGNEEDVEYEECYSENDEEEEEEEEDNRISIQAFDNIHPRNADDDANLGLYDDDLSE